MSVSTAPPFTTLYHKLVVGRVQTPTLQCWWRDGKISTFQKESISTSRRQGDLTADLEKVKTEEEAKDCGGLRKTSRRFFSQAETKTVNPRSSTI